MKSLVQINMNYRLILIFGLFSLLAFSGLAIQIDKSEEINSRIHQAEVEMNFDIEFWKNLAKEAADANCVEQQAKCLNNVGYILLNQGKLDEAVLYYHQSLDLYTKINSASGKAGVYNDLGGIYSDINEKKKAKEYYSKAHKIYLSIKDKFGISMTAHNLSSLYADEKNYTEAEKLARLSFHLSKQINDSAGLPSILNNLGSLHERKGDIDSAIFYYQHAYSITRKIKLQEGIGYVSISLGENFFTQYKNHLTINKDEKSLLDSCEKYLLNAFKTGEEMNHPEIMKRSAQRLQRFYEYKKDLTKAYFYSEKFHRIKDTLENAQRQKDILKSQLEYEHNLDRLKTEEQTRADKAIADEHAKQQRMVLIGAVFLIVLLFVFILFVIRKWRQTGEQKKIIELQKQIVEDKQKEIIDSINYAQRLQHAILTPESEIKKFFSNSFLFYLPKDIVAGDFYFFEKTESHIFYAAADCTGHGVPGALVSIVCSNALTRCVKEFELTDPGKILDKARELILETFEKSGEDVKDGMDISLISIAMQSRKQSENESGERRNAYPHLHSILTLSWAGANNPLWYIDNGELIEIAPDKQPIGKTENPKPFISHVLPPTLSTLFLFTDGFADQFGGEKGKKFKYSNLQKLLIENSKQSCEIQKQKLESDFFKWKGDLEQVDDVCIIGIQL